MPLEHRIPCVLNVIATAVGAHQGHHAHALQLPVGAAGDAPGGGAPRAWGGAGAQRGRDGAHGAEAAAEILASAHPALDLLGPDGRALLLLLDHPAGEHGSTSASQSQAGGG